MGECTGAAAPPDGEGPLSAGTEFSTGVWPPRDWSGVGAKDTEGLYASR